MISTAEFAARRQQLLAQLPNNTIVIVPAAQEVTRSNDTEYHFRQNSDFFYLSGFNEPDSFLILSNAGKSQNADNTKKSNVIESAIFVRPTNELDEVWHGRRLGVNAAPLALKIDIAYSTDDIAQILPELLNQHDYLYYQLDANAYADKLVQAALATCNKAPKQSMVAPATICDVSRLIHSMRLIKSPAELAVLQQSADISCKAHCLAMQTCKPGMFEYQLEATILHSFAMQGARFAAYNTIVGGGENACILHYTQNSDALKSGDLVLIDAGSEYAAYAADITRTFPVNGKFSAPQVELYELVLASQLASLALLKAGNTIDQAMQVAVKIITQGLIDLGILQGDLSQCIAQNAHKEFFMHGLGHYLGLDVHDVGVYKHAGQDIPLQVGMVMTVEPGIYIPATAKVPDCYKGIGIRIEDNIVITAHGNEVLTAKVPKTIAAIEALMAAQ